MDLDEIRSRIEQLERINAELDEKIEEVKKNLSSCSLEMVLRVLTSESKDHLSNKKANNDEIERLTNHRIALEKKSLNQQIKDIQRGIAAAMKRL